MNESRAFCVCVWVQLHPNSSLVTLTCGVLWHMESVVVVSGIAGVGLTEVVTHKHTHTYLSTRFTAFYN